jgi:hypothetical protein
VDKTVENYTAVILVPKSTARRARGQSSSRGQIP